MLDVVVADREAFDEELIDDEAAVEEAAACVSIFQWNLDSKYGSTDLAA